MIETHNIIHRIGVMAKRLLADRDFVEIYIEGVLSQHVEDAIREMDKAHGHDLERATARLLQAREIRGWFQRAAETHEATMRAEKEASERPAGWVNE